MSGIGKTGMNQNRDVLSVWRIYMPSDVDRETYIKTCFLTGSVTLINENGEILHNVKIGRLSLQLISFPADVESFGSEVVVASMGYSGKLYVIDVFNGSNEFFDQEENQYRFFKNDGKGGYSELRVDGAGKMLLTVDGEGETELVISVTNKDRAGKLTVNVNGEIMVVNDGKTTVQTSTEIQLEHYDSEADERTFVNIAKDLIKVFSKKIVHNDGSEPMLRGQKAVDLLGELFDALAKESAGPYPLKGASSYGQMKSKLSDIKSELSFLK